MRGFLKPFAALAVALLFCTFAAAQQELPPSDGDGPMKIPTTPAGPFQFPDGAYRVGNGVNAAKLVEPGEGHYSPEALAAGYQVTGLVNCTVDTSGAPSRIVAGIEFGQGLREKAAEAVGNSRFQPGTLNGAPVAVHTRVAVSFRIADGKPEIAVYEPSEVELQSLLRARMEARRAMGLPPAGRGPMGSQMSADGVKRTPPRVLHSVEAEFSEEARRRKYQGVVTVSLVVNEKGLPTDLKIVNGLDYGLSDQALDAVSQYRFAPATENGKPVPAQISVQVSFKLY